MPRPPAGCWPWRWCWRGWTGPGRPRPAGWTGRRCGEADQETVRGTVSPPNGFTAPMPKAWRGCLTAGKACGFRALRPPGWRTSGPSVEAGPDPARDGVVRWRRQDLQRRIAEAFGVEVHERPVGQPLVASLWRRLGFAGCRSRPQHPKTDPDARSRRSRKLPRSGCGGDPAGRARQTRRGLVPG